MKSRKSSDIPSVPPAEPSPEPEITPYKAYQRLAMLQSGLARATVLARLIECIDLSEEFDLTDVASIAESIIRDLVEAKEFPDVVCPQIMSTDLNGFMGHRRFW
jgi:hypothetical protein